MYFLGSGFGLGTGFCTGLALYVGLVSVIVSPQMVYLKEVYYSVRSFAIFIVDFGVLVW